MKPKKIITIQYSVLAILSFIVFFLPFIKYELSIPALHQTLDVISFNGIRLLSAFFADPAEYIKIDELLPLFYDLKKYFCILAVFALCVPILLLVASGILHLFHLRKEKMPWWQVAFPLLSILSMGGGWYGVSRALQGVINDFVEEMSGQIAGTGEGLSAVYMDVSSFYEDTINDILQNTVEIRISGSVGYYILLIVILILLAEDIILPKLWKEKTEKRIIPVSGGGKADLPENIVPDAVYKEEVLKSGKENTEKPERIIQTWSDSTVFEKEPGWAALNRPRNGMIDDPTQRTGQRKGRLIGLRGEYAGAEIVMMNGEKIVLGRSREKCNLILSNPKVSRKHCEIYYDAVEDKYVIVNCSLNGTFLSGGQLLEQGKRYHLPHGTIFRVDKEDEFRLL